MRISLIKQTTSLAPSRGGVKVFKPKRLFSFRCPPLVNSMDMRSGVVHKTN